MVGFGIVRCTGFSMMMNSKRWCNRNKVKQQDTDSGWRKDRLELKATEDVDR